MELGMIFLILGEIALVVGISMIFMYLIYRLRFVPPSFGAEVDTIFDRYGISCSDRHALASSPFLPEHIGQLSPKELELVYLDSDAKTQMLTELRALAGSQC